MVISIKSCHFKFVRYNKGLNYVTSCINDSGASSRHAISLTLSPIPDSHAASCRVAPASAACWLTSFVPSFTHPSSPPRFPSLPLHYIHLTKSSKTSPSNAEQENGNRFAKAAHSESPGGSTRTRTGPRFTLYCHRYIPLQNNPRNQKLPLNSYTCTNWKLAQNFRRELVPSLVAWSIRASFFLRLAASETQNGPKDASEK